MDITPYTVLSIGKWRMCVFTIGETHIWTRTDLDFWSLVSEL